MLHIRHTLLAFRRRAERPVHRMNHRGAAHPSLGRPTHRERDLLVESAKARDFILQRREARLHLTRRLVERDDVVRGCEDG